MTLKALVLDRNRAMDFSPMSSACYILFEEPNHKYPKTLPKAGWWDTLTIRCHDITKPIDGYVHFTPEMAGKIVDFITRNKSRSFVVSCDAGISRSVAVGTILRDYFGYKVDFVAAMNDDFRNVLICAEIARVLRGVEK